MNNYLNIIKKTGKEFFYFTKDYGIVYAFFNLVWWLNFYLISPFRFKLSNWAILHKTNFLSNFIESNYKNTIDKFQNKNNSELVTEVPKIWVFWAQGKDKMPQLVKACYNQLIKFNQNVILLTNENYKNYVDLPDGIIKKSYSGKLSWANFSDILRNSLLYKYGGLWIDATVWVSGKIPFEKFEHLQFFSPNGIVPYSKKAMCFWTSYSYNWSTWCLWSNSKNLPLFGFTSEIMKEIALSDKVWPDYVFQDFLYFFAIQNLSGIESVFKENSKIKCNKRNELATIMNQPFIQSKYQELCKNDFVFKLSYRTKYNHKNTNNNLTFYEIFINNRDSNLW